MFSDSLAHKRCCIYLLLTEVAGEGGPDLAPQIFSHQKKIFIITMHSKHSLYLSHS